MSAARRARHFSVVADAWRCAIALRWLIALCLLAPATLPAAQPAPQRAGDGVLESARVLPRDRLLAVSGWAAPERPNVFITQLIVNIGGQTIYRGRMLRGERPDVVHVTGRADWLPSGFSALIALPGDLGAGVQPVEVRMRLGDGTQFTLRTEPDAATVVVPAAPSSPDHWVVLAAALALLAPLAALLPGAAPRVRVAPRRQALMFGAALALSFALLVASGLTGSSIALLLDADAAVTRGESAVWLGEPRPVRSDEWEVITPLALAQWRHDPPLPVVNRNVGADGANMLVIGMSGVPVAHVSSLAKPATWGFFVFDLKRALAWYWWFPFFACFAALWALLLRMFGTLDWRAGAMLAAGVALAPYSVVFSGWPAYLVFFGALALLLAHVALCSTRVATAAAAGAALGLALAGYALVLYPAWQISVGWLLALLALGWFARDRGRLRFGAAQAVALLAAVAVCAALLLGWWLDAHDAVQIVRGTVYPGQRSAETGGDIDRWFLAKGLMSAVTMYLPSPLTNASDAGSFVFLLLPIAAGALALWFVARRVDALAALPMAFIATVLGFVFIGFPAPLARLTLWSSTTSYRLDLALGLAQTLLLAWLIAAAAAAVEPPRRWERALAFVVALLAALHGATLLRRVPPQIAELLPPSLALLICAALAAAAFLLLTRRHAAFLLLFGAWTLAPALPFNPLAQAPGSIGLAPALGAIDDLGAPDAAGRRGVAVLDRRDWSLTLPAAGVPVVNSVFYHPQKSLWRTLDPDDGDRVLHNRYQRLLFVAAPIADGRPWRVESPRLDEVRVTLDAARFDFALLGARFVLAPPRDADALAQNPTLRERLATRDYLLYELR